MFLKNPLFPNDVRETMTDEYAQNVTWVGLMVQLFGTVLHLQEQSVFALTAWMLLLHFRRLQTL